MSVELFLSMLTISIAVTILLTEVLKKLLMSAEVPYRVHAVVLDSAMVSCTGVGVIYRLPFGLGFELIQMYRLLFLILFTWIMSMLVYDKIIQTKAQYDRYKKQMEDMRNKKHH